MTKIESPYHNCGFLITGDFNRLDTSGFKNSFNVYKCIHKEAPRYIEDFFKIKICNYNLRGSGTLLMLPNFNLEWRHKSFSFSAAKLWNSLPTYVTNAKDISTFKCLLKKQVFR